MTAGKPSDLPYDRYRVLNLTNLNTKRTVEFRVFSGTTNAVKALGYIRLCLAIVEKALRSKRNPKWTPVTPVTTSPLYRKGGKGQTEITRLFYSLGWIKGDCSHVHGNVQVDGIPTIDDCKPTLMRLAKKYDDRNEDENHAA